MTAVLQLLLYIAAIVGLVIFGFYRDKREHKDLRQQSLHFPQQTHDHEHEGAAMSRVR